jgi:probable LLM family oxidoreductase
MSFTLGLDSFGEVPGGLAEGRLPDAQTIARLVGEGVAAERAGVDHFAIGEHHIAVMPVSTPDVVLAAIAGRTERIRLSSGVTVLSSDDPVRVYQRYATLQAVSGGRAELIVGRGSSVESFPLYGYDLADYEVLFEEKLELLARLRTGQPVHWQGSVRAPLAGTQVYPRTEHGIPLWVGVGGSPQSAVRAARADASLMLAVIGGPPARFAPLSRLYSQARTRLGLPTGRIGVHSPGHVAETDDLAAEQYWPHYRRFFADFGAARGIAAPTRAAYEHEIVDGSLYIGSPATVADKIVRTARTLGAGRFDLKYGVAGMPHELFLDAIELYGREVAPRVREAMSTTSARHTDSATSTATVPPASRNPTA